RELVIDQHDALVADQHDHVAGPGVADRVDVLLDLEPGHLLRTEAALRMDGRPRRQGNREDGARHQCRDSHSMSPSPSAGPDDSPWPGTGAVISLSANGLLFRRGILKLRREKESAAQQGEEPHRACGGAYAAFCSTSTPAPVFEIGVW